MYSDHLLIEANKAWPIGGRIIEVPLYLALNPSGKSTIFIVPFRNKQFPKSEVRDPLTHIGLRITNDLPMGIMVANMPNPILWNHFLRHYVLAVNMGHKRLADTRINLFVLGVISSSPSPSPSLLPQQLNDDFTAVCSNLLLLHKYAAWIAQ